MVPENECPHSAHVAQHLEAECGGELQAPLPLPGAEMPRESLRTIVPLQLRGTEVHRPAHRVLRERSARRRPERCQREHCARHSPAVTVDQGHGGLPAGRGAR